MIRAFLTVSALACAGPVAAQERSTPVVAPVRTYGQETVIQSAAGGGIRTFDQGAPGSDVVYLQDRLLRWYRVQLTGSCFPNRAQDTAIYRLGPDGRLDRFSSLASARFPERWCGVTSILRSDAPPNHPKVRVPTQRELDRQPRG